MASSQEPEQAERKRKLKFSSMELQVLVEEVVKVHHRRFGKVSLTVPESAKRKIWLEILQKVNAVGVTTRVIEDLKKRFYDLRWLTKKKLADHHKQASKTGGGGNTAPPLTDLEELVATTLEAESVHGLGEVDSSVKSATKKGHTSRRQSEEAEGTAPERDDSQEPGPSASQDKGVPSGQPPSQESDISEQMHGSPIPSQSPLFVSSPEMPASLVVETPAANPSRRHVVSPRLEMEIAADEMVGEDSPNLSQADITATLQPSTEPVPVTTRRRTVQGRSVGARGEGSSVFQGLEGTMVRIQRMQGKGIMSCQRQMRNMNINMQEIGTGIRELVEANKSMATGIHELVEVNTSMATGIHEMSQSMELLCSKLDSEIISRRREKQRAQRTEISIHQLATATSLLCRRSINNQEVLTHNSNQLTRGIAGMTGALEVLLSAQSSAIDVPDTEASTSRSSTASPHGVEPRRSSRRQGEATGQTPSEQAEPQTPASAKRGRK
ncbi:uncharacterized protein LOC144785554 [Lissotriton helveticus]